MFARSHQYSRLLALARKQAPTAASCRIRTDWFRPSSAAGVHVCDRATAARALSSSVGAAAHDGPSASDCARHLSELSDGGLAAEDLARHLSPGARREIAEARKRIGGGVEGRVTEPTRRDLRLVAINQSIPFVGFGIMDNAILILAGDAIDNTLGLMLGISTLCAAALGNIISDLAGVALGTVIEDFCAKLNLPQANLTQMQRQLRSVRFAGQFGCAAGITVGCIIGMFPLFFIDTHKGERLKQEAHLVDIFDDMVTEAKELIGAEHAYLFTVVGSDKETMPLPLADRSERGRYLYGGYMDESKEGSAKPAHTHIPLDRGILSRSVLTRKYINCKNVREDHNFDYDTDIISRLPKDKVKEMLCVPVFDAHGNVIAVIQAVNKIGKGIARNDDCEEKGFTKNEIKILRALATHVSVSIENLNEEEEKVSLRDTLRILKAHATTESDDHLDHSAAA